MAARDTTSEPTGWVIFAGVMMLLIGFLNFFAVKFDTADQDFWINGVAVTIRDDGRADSIEQLLVPAPA